MTKQDRERQALLREKIWRNTAGRLPEASPGKQTAQAAKPVQTSPAVQAASNLYKIDEKSLGVARDNRIVLVTDQKKGNAPIVVIETVNVKGQLAGRRIDANKVITSYGREQIANDIIRAAADGRLLHLDKKGSQNCSLGYQSPILCEPYERLTSRIIWQVSGEMSNRDL